MDPDHPDPLDALKRADRKHESTRAAAKQPITPAEAERIRALCAEASRLIAQRLQQGGSAPRDSSGRP